jgi:hypothetical protein
MQTATLQADECLLEKGMEDGEEWNPMRDARRRRG